MLKGTIVENSLSNKDILQNVKIERTWKSSNWTLHSVLIDEKILSEIGHHLADGPWYIHFWEPGKDPIHVVFKSKMFEVNSKDKSTWKEAIEYGKSIGIPEQQLDFLIE